MKYNYKDPNNPIVYIRARLLHSEGSERIVHIDGPGDSKGFVFPVPEDVVVPRPAYTNHLR